MPPSVTLLETRGILQIAGADARNFLQGLITTDIDKASETRALYGALLTPQGKYLHDFFVVQMGDCIYLEAEKARLADLAKRLLLYKLRADIAIADVTGEFHVYALFGEGALAALNVDADPGVARAIKGGCLYVDPRLAAAGARAMLPTAPAPDFEGFAAYDFNAYDRFRIGLGLADGSRDLVPEKSLLLDYGFDELNGIDWEKGCYVGQEVTARMKHRGLARKRLMPVRLEGETPEPGAAVRMGAREIGTQTVGTLTSVCGDIGLALLQLDAVEKAAKEGTALEAGATRLVPTPPAWRQR